VGKFILSLSFGNRHLTLPLRIDNLTKEAKTTIEQDSVDLDSFLLIQYIGAFTSHSLSFDLGGTLFLLYFSRTRLDMYKKRFENIFRVAKKVTSSLDIGDILEIIRDEAKITIPHAREACLLMFDPEALRYTRPLHCAVYKNRINCQLCKRGRETIKGALARPMTLRCAFQQSGNLSSQAASSDDSICEVALPIYDGQQPLAVLDVIAKEGRGFDQRDLMLLKDLADLATNAIVNTRKHWKVAQEKLNLDQILVHLRPFVPETVQKIIEKNPAMPSLEKRDMDVSILFLDVAGYTKISETLTQEKVNFIIEKYFSSFLDIIYANQGDINETAGDGLMVIFQGTERENALNASRAALNIHARTTEIRNELEGRFEPIQVNMGINSGIASVGMTRFRGAAGTRMTFTASGAATNLAARIASAAAGGDVLIGPETAGRIKDEINFFDRGLMNFKNVKGEVRVYSLIRANQI
jgi:class 3 adenylate cyclase